MQQQDFYEIVFTATSATEGIDMLHSSPAHPHIILLDLKMPGVNGVELTQLLKEKYPAIHIIIISSHYQDNFLSFMIKHGCAAFFPKE